MAMPFHKPIQLQPGDVERFWSLVDRRSSDECWPWAGACFANSIPRKKRKWRLGYGRFYVTCDGRNESYRANRVALYLKTGVDPGELQACLTCQNHLCMNPGHLFAGTDQDRMDECVNKHRQATGDNAASRLYPGIRKGELSGRAKVSEIQARQILALGAAAIAAGCTKPGRRIPKGLTKEIRTRLGNPDISDLIVSSILRRRRWKHL